MRGILCAIIAALLLAPAKSSADVVFHITGGELGVSFGLVPLTISDEIHEVFGSPFTIDGSADVTSGPLLDLFVDVPSGVTIYTYGPGTLTITATDGTFASSIAGFSLRLCEGCDDLFGGALADDVSIALGPGLFDAGLAHLLGVGRHTLGGSLSLGLEAIDGDPTSTVRDGFDHRGYAELAIGTTVPEPGLPLLTLASGFAWMTRARLLRRR